MSIADPVLVNDLHAENQAGYDPELAAEQGVEVTIHKAGQGGRWVPDGFRQKFFECDKYMKLNGFYYFLDSTISGEAQAWHFARIMRSVGGPEGRLVVVDFEPYRDPLGSWDFSPTNKNLRDFVRELKDQTDGHPVIAYSFANFWNGLDPTGPAEDYGIDALWEARVAVADEKKRNAKHYYYQLISNGFYSWQTSFGDMKPIMWQYTWGGLLGGAYLDTSASRVGLPALNELARTP